MSGLGRENSIVLIGSYPPRRCGIATFTCDLFSALRHARPHESMSVIAITESGFNDIYPGEVAFDIQRDVVADYQAAAVRLNRARTDLVCIQHEFGIFGGDAGAHILALIEQLECPVVVTLHTVLAAPTPEQRAVMARLLASVDRVVVMANKAKTLLMEVYDALEAKIALIPHGAPDCPLTSTHDAKLRLGYDGRALLLTFGLLSANKGVEDMIRAMPDIVRACPEALYLVLGATHPNVRAREGEVYREQLVALAHDLGVAQAVAFEDAFVDRKTLIRFLRAADIYVTPYLNPAQITSGTLAYAVALGRPVISTPYWHAQELLDEDRGMLVPFHDPTALGEAAKRLLLDPDYRAGLSRRAYASGRDMIWSRVGVRYLQLFERLGALKPPQPTQTQEGFGAA